MKLRVLIVLLIVSLAMVSCVGDMPSVEEKKIVLGYSQLGSESAWRSACTKSIQDSAEREGIQLIFFDAEQKFENQVKAIRSFIIYQVDVIAFSPIVRTGWDSVLSEAKEAGIPVLLIDRDISTEDPSLFTSYAGSDFWQEGIQAGKFLLQYMEREGIQANIVELRGTDGSGPEIGRREGFAETIAGRASVVYSESGDFMNSRGYEITRNILKSDIDFNVLFSHNDAMTMGAIKAMEEHGVSPGKDIAIITVDGEQAAIDALKQGKINCVIECNPMLGDTVMEMTKQLINGETLPRTIYTEETVFTMYDENLSELAPRGY